MAKFNKNTNSPAVLYTSTLRQFQLFRFVGLNRTYFADTVDGNLCWSTVLLLPCLWNSYRFNKVHKIVSTLLNNIIENMDPLYPVLVLKTNDDSLPSNYIIINNGSTSAGWL